MNKQPQLSKIGKHKQPKHNNPIQFTHGTHTQIVNVPGKVPEPSVSNLYMRGTRVNYIDISYHTWYLSQLLVCTRRGTQINHGNILNQA